MKGDERRHGEAHEARERGSSELRPPQLTLHPTEGTERETVLGAAPLPPLRDVWVGWTGLRSDWLRASGRTSGDTVVEAEGAPAAVLPSCCEVARLILTAPSATVTPSTSHQRANAPLLGIGTLL